MNWEEFKQFVTTDYAKRVLRNELEEKAGIVIPEDERLLREYFEFIHVCAMVSNNPREFSECLVSAKEGIPYWVQTRKGPEPLRLDDKGLLKQEASRKVILDLISHPEEWKEKADQIIKSEQEKVKSEVEKFYSVISKGFVTVESFTKKE